MVSKVNREDHYTYILPYCGSLFTIRKYELNLYKNKLKFIAIYVIWVLVNLI